MAPPINTNFDIFDLTCGYTDNNKAIFVKGPVYSLKAEMTRKKWG